MTVRPGRWRLHAGFYDLLIARRGTVGTPLDERLEPEEARRALAWALRDRRSDTAVARRMAAIAREVVRDVGLGFAAPTREVVEAALLQRVLVAWRAPPLPPPRGTSRPEGESTDPGPYIPLASELIRERYEQGIEVDDELIEDDPGAIEFWDEASDDPGDAVEVEDEAEDEPADAVEVEDEADDAPVEVAAPEADGGPAARVPTSEDDAEIEVEDSIEDDECDEVEEESEGDDPAEPDCGDAVDPSEEAPAAAEGGETGSR